MLAEPKLRGALVENYWGQNRGRPVRMGGTGRKSGPQIRKREEEQREKQRCKDTVTGNENDQRPGTHI